MAARDGDKTVVDELPGIVTIYYDGSIVRHNSHTTTPPTEFPTDATVASKDVVLNPVTGLWARLFLPHHQQNVPLAVYFHGGGFCFGDPAWDFYTRFISRLATATSTLWASVAYRLAPEHRLPVGFHDCLDAISSLTTSTDLWLKGTDCRHVFLAGDSAGGDLVYNCALHHCKEPHNRVEIVGLMLFHPGFIKEERSASETDSPKELVQVDATARMALPPGEDKNYFMLNPRVPPVAETRLPPCLVVVGGKDLFRDRQVEFCEKMEGMGQMVEVVWYEEMRHCFMFEEDTENSPEADDMVEKTVSFMERCGGFKKEG
ncbi:probable carboxylesterase 6 [Amborella trichopoda]|uniref:Alpha/beta hydrolase fold-3 domain-containing protein n=1 Tax=Amborella trichopoda TaxID=13333 RepID=W1PT03_AMBTC|nr:probable carboxylesterase 6 [Amborella trichopoda]ERN10984.1 hypothetical protein AMTR_s00160p00062470 [Amborella trichopoda]|eukprot:XP_006849403.1 probable carboxylesterase 6 [Amborella trichopoda]